MSLLIARSRKTMGHIMVTQDEVRAYRHMDDRRFPLQLGLGGAAAWLVFYALVVVGGAVANSGKGMEVIAAVLH
jgi:hypothetical protein